MYFNKEVNLEKNREEDHLKLCSLRLFKTKDKNIVWHLIDVFIRSLYLVRVDVMSRIHVRDGGECAGVLWVCKQIFSEHFVLGYLL